MQRPSPGHVGIGVVLIVLGLVLLRSRREGPRVPPPTPRTAHFARSLHATHFIRGNLHAHTRQSDGGDSPAEVIQWYRDHHYGFVAITDHDVYSSAATLGVAPDPAFAVLPGEEISMWVHGLQVHVNALCTHSLIASGTFPDARQALEHAVTEVARQGGVALINHPNFDWALSPDDVLSVPGARLLEIASGHPYVHTAGDPAHPGHEAIWDQALARGIDMMGVGVDDVHHLASPAEPAAYPGVAWVQVIAPAVTEAAICEALGKGDLYASTGAELSALHVEGATYEVWPVDHDATVAFIGNGGHTLAQVQHCGGKASYHAQGYERYVRARIETGAGMAWTPAVRVE
jgi:hypothetical protein